jgi:acyl dehydratase
MILARFRMPALAVTIGLAAVAVPLLSLAAPAQAAAGENVGGGGPASAWASAPSVISSRAFAGYQAPVAPGSATSSAAQFKVPRLSCTAADRGITPGAGVVVNNFRSDSSAFLFAVCHRGRAVYFPALDLNGHEVSYTTPVHAGNVIKVSAKVTTRSTTVQITDVTTGVTKRRTGPGARSSAAFAGDDSVLLNGTLLGVPRFGTLTFTRCFIDGRALARSHPFRYQRVNRRNIVQIATGALSSGGTAFPTYYRHF